MTGGEWHLTPVAPAAPIKVMELLGSISAAGVAVNVCAAHSGVRTPRARAEQRHRFLQELFGNLSDKAKSELVYGQWYELKVDGVFGGLLLFTPPGGTEAQGRTN